MITILLKKWVQPGLADGVKSFLPIQMVRFFGSSFHVNGYLEECSQFEVFSEKNFVSFSIIFRKYNSQLLFANIILWIPVREKSGFVGGSLSLHIPFFSHDWIHTSYWIWSALHEVLLPKVLGMEVSI